jgi:hypothetical protein
VYDGAASENKDSRKFKKEATAERQSLSTGPHLQAAATMSEWGSGALYRWQIPSEVWRETTLSTNLKRN